MFRLNRKILIVFVLVAVLGAGFFYKDQAINYVLGLPQIKRPVDNFFSNVQDVTDVAKEVFTPPPLRFEKDAEGSLLSRAGVVRWTNVYREENGFLPLVENTQLNYAAVEKLNDMFDGQYFAHVSPLGLGVSHWVDRAGYEYLIIGENLALGNFENDGELVQAWMDSPGHRENILNSKYKEIGVATGKGDFEGKETWLAVQVFARPVSDCPQPSIQLESKIRIYETNITKTESSLMTLKTQIEAISIRKRSLWDSYNKLAEQYNALVAQYSTLVEELGVMIEVYNVQARELNNCVNNL